MHEPRQRNGFRCQVSGNIRAEELNTETFNNFERNKMKLILEILLALGLIGQAVIGLAFFISCIWEDEKRASVFAGLQFAGMLGLVVLFFYLKMTGYFDTDIGFGVLILTVVFGVFAIYFLTAVRLRF